MFFARKTSLALTKTVIYYFFPWIKERPMTPWECVFVLGGILPILVLIFYYLWQELKEDKLQQKTMAKQRHLASIRFIGVWWVLFYFGMVFSYFAFSLAATQVLGALGGNVILCTLVTYYHSLLLKRPAEKQWRLRLGSGLNLSLSSVIGGFALVAYVLIVILFYAIPMTLKDVVYLCFAGLATCCSGTFGIWFLTKKYPAWPVKTYCFSVSKKALFCTSASVIFYYLLAFFLIFTSVVAFIIP